MTAVGSPIRVPGYPYSMGELRIEEDEYFYEAKSAFNGLIPPGAPKILSCNLNVVLIASARQLSFVSTSAQDSIAGTGARMLLLIYFDSTHTLNFEIIVMNGVTPVNSVATDITKIQSIYVTAVGSLTYAAGDITVSDVPASANLYGCIEQYNVVFRRCLVWVPPGRIGVVPYLTVSSRTSGGVNFQIIGSVNFAPLGGDEDFPFTSAELEMSNGGALSMPLNPPLRVDARYSTVPMPIWLQVFATAATNQDASGAFLYYDFVPDY